MFIGPRERHKAGYRGTEQWARGPFLILFTGDSRDRDPATGLRPLYGAVREVSLHQFGHFMMGRARIGGRTITVSGPFGGDGLPTDLDKLRAEDMKFLTRMPDDLARRYWKSDDQHPAPHEEIRTWALGLAVEREKRRTGAGARHTSSSACRSTHTGRFKKC